METDGSVLLDAEVFYEGKQTEPAVILEWCRPLESLQMIWSQWSEESVAKMRDRGDVPRVTGQGARPKTACVVKKMGDDHFDNLKGKLGGYGLLCGDGLWWILSEKQVHDSPARNSQSE